MDINICLVCPSDVRLEETVAQSVINRLRDQYAQEATINCTLAHQHESASTTAEQNGFANESFDVLIAVLWTTAEHDFLRALPQNVSSMPKKCLIYRRLSLLDTKNLRVIDQERLAAQLLKLEDFCTQLQSHSDFPPDAWRTFEDPTRFPELLEKDLQSLIEERIFGELPPAGSWSGTPFPGLSAYSIQHALVYCGREAAVEKTFRLLIDRASMKNPSILIAGASGSGKSSLARCGLANRLAKKFLNVPQIEMRPGAGDSEPPARIFAKLLEVAIPQTAGFRMEQILQQNPSAAINILEGIQSRQETAAGTPYLILILDQLEELTSSQADGNAVQSFTTALNLLVRRGLCWCIATIRSDKIGTLAEVPDLSFLLESSGLHFLEPPTPAEIGLMIRRPARLAGLAYERHAGSAQSLDELIQQEATEKPNILPLLQFTLSQIYETRTETGVLRFEDYRRMGGIPGCVAAHAEAVFTVLPETVQATFHTVFRELVTVAADSEAPSRQWLQPGTFSGDANAIALIDALVDGRLLVRDQQGTHGAVEIVHESLLRDWPRLAAWLQKETEFLRKRSRVLQSYKRWINGGKRKDLLLPSGTALDEAVDVQKNGLLVAEKDAQEPEIAEYLQESRRHAAFRSRARKFAITSLSLLTLVSIILALVTRTALDSATQLNADFLKQKDVAEAAASNAVKAQLNSLDLSLDSVQGTLKELEQLATNELLNDHHTPSLRYLHTAETVADQRRSELLQQIDERFTAIKQNPVLATLFQPALREARNRVTATRALDPAYWQQREAVMLRELPEIQWRRNLHRRIDEAILSPDRRLLLLVAADVTGNDIAIVWDLEKNTPTRCITRFNKDIPRAIATWAPDSQSFFLFSMQSDSTNPLLQPSTFTRIDAHTGDALSKPVTHSGVILAASCSRDGRFLYVVNQFDGVAAAYLAFANNQTKLADADAGQSITSVAPSGATASVIRYDLQSMKRTIRKTFDTELVAAAISGDWCAVSPAVQPAAADDSDPSMNGTCLLSLETDAEYWSLEGQGNGRIGLSEDGQFLAVNQMEGGFVLLQRSADGLKKVAAAGVSVKIEQIIVRRPASQPASQGVVQIILGEVQQSRDEQLSTYNTAQKIAAYTYDPQSNIMQNTLSGDTRSNIVTLALQAGDTGDRIAAGLSDGTVRIWQQYPGRTLTPRLQVSGKPLLVEFLHATGGRPDSNPPFITVTSDGEITRWNPENNALQEPIDPRYLSGLLKYRPKPPTTSLPPVISQAPDESVVLSVSPDLATAGQLAIGRDHPDSLPEILDVGISVEDIFWSSDSRYAIVMNGRVKRNVTGPNSLQPAMWKIAGVEPTIPGRSQMAVIDLSSRQRVGDVLTIDGPIVGLQTLTSESHCLLGFLSLDKNTGHLWRVDLATGTHTELNSQGLQFSSFSASEDCAVVAVTDRDGLPWLLRKDRPAERLSVSDPEARIFEEICLSESGETAVLVPIFVDAPVWVTNLVASKSWPVEENKKRDGVRFVHALPQSNSFVLGGAAAELLVMSGETGTVSQRIPLPAPATGFACSRDQRMLAVADRGFSVRVFDLETWHPVNAPWQQPFDNSFALRQFRHTSAQFQFSASGDLLISCVQPEKVRLAAPPATTRWASLVQNFTKPSAQIPCTIAGSELGKTAPTEQLPAADWIDNYFYGSSIAKSQPETALNLLTATPLPRSSDEPWATPRTQLILELATRLQELDTWRQTVNWLSRTENVSALPVVDAASVIRNASILSFETARLAYENSVLSSAENDIAQISSLLVHGRLSAMRGDFSEAQQAYWQVTLLPGFRKLFPSNSRLIFATLFEGLCGLKTDESPSEIPTTFALIEGERRPEIAISLRYYCYLAGLPTKTGIELLPADPAGDVRIRLFHEFCEQFEQSDGGEKALEIARQMVRLSSDQFRIPVDGVNLFPILRGHCRLFEADALCRLKRFPEAVIAVDNAEKDWQAFNRQIEDLGLETRYFWPERIGFEHLKQRLLSVVAAGSPH